MSDLNIIYPEGLKLTLQGQEVTINKFKFGQLPKVMRAIKSVAGPALQAFQTGVEPNLELFMEAGAEASSDLMQLMAECIKKPVSFIEDLDPDEGIKLIGAFFEVNADFFIKKVLPELKNLAAKRQMKTLQK